MATVFYIALLINTPMAKIVEDKVILGIDPGTSIMGYGIIQVKNRKLSLVAMGVIHLAKLGDHQIRLKRIFDRTIHLIEEFKPDEAAIEAQFFGKNVQSMLKLGRAQGVAIAASLSKNIPIEEYLPKKVKKSVTGRGQATKEQVAAMLKTIVPYEADPKYLDATDALAVAVCHYFQSGSPTKTKGASSWDAFLKQNPDRKA